MTVRDHIVSVRLNDDEYKFLKKLAGRNKISDVLRQRIFNETLVNMIPSGNVLINGHEPLKY